MAKRRNTSNFIPLSRSSQHTSKHVQISFNCLISGRARPDTWAAAITSDYNFIEAPSIFQVFSSPALSPRGPRVHLSSALIMTTCAPLGSLSLSLWPFYFRARRWQYGIYDIYIRHPVKFHKLPVDAAMRERYIKHLINENC